MKQFEQLHLVKKFALPNKPAALGLESLVNVLRRLWKQTEDREDVCEQRLVGDSPIRRILVVPGSQLVGKLLEDVCMLGADAEQ